MNFIYLEPNQVPANFKAGYFGKKFKVLVTNSVIIPADAGLWSGGSVHTYECLDLATGIRCPIADHMASPMDPNRQEKVIPLSPGIAVVQHSIFQGKDLGLAFYVHPDNASLLIAHTSDELSVHEKLVLKATRSFKSSYMGKDRYEMMKDETEYDYKKNGTTFPSRDEWNAAKQKLIEKAMLDKRGAITVKGKNAL